MNDRYLQMLWLADNDPVKKEAFDKIPMVEYYVMLNKKDEENKKALKKQASKQGK